MFYFHWTSLLGISRIFGWMHGSHFGNSTSFGISGNFSWKFLCHLPLFPIFERFGWMESARCFATTTTSNNIGFMSKTTALHVHHAFWCISLTSTARLRLETSQCDVLWRTWTYENKFSVLYLNMDKANKNLTPGKVAYIWQIKRFQIDAIKFERTEIHFC